MTSMTHLFTNLYSYVLWNKESLSYEIMVQIMFHKCELEESYIVICFMGCSSLMNNTDLIS